jgi:hypothetical protein
MDPDISFQPSITEQFCSFFLSSTAVTPDRPELFLPWSFRRVPEFSFSIGLLPSHQISRYFRTIEIFNRLSTAVSCGSTGPARTRMSLSTHLSRTLRRDLTRASAFPLETEGYETK